MAEEVVDLARITLLRKYPESEGKVTGVGVYSDSLEAALRSSNMSYDRIKFKLDIDEGYLKSLIYGFVKPFFDVLWSNADLYHATDELCCLYMPFMKGKKIVTFHHVFRGNEGRSPTLKIVWKFAAKVAVRYSDVIIAVSERTKEELIEKMGVEKERIRVIMHGADPYFVDMNMPRKKVIGFVGALIGRKNLAGGLRAFKLFTEMPGTEDYRYVICGRGHLKDDLVRLADELSISDRVDFISRLSNEELLEFYNTMSVFANSAMHEGLGLTALEAQACGTPVVFFRDADIPSEATENFIPADDEYDFARKMHELISEPYRKSVTNDHDGDRQDSFKRTLELYREVLQQADRTRS